MGWTDLFRTKSTKLKPEPEIRWFGKLPTYADYYTSGTDDAWAVEFNDWVLKGFELYQKRIGAGAGRRLPISGCLIRLPKSGMTVLAAIQDYGGDLRGRPFPICFYVGLPTVAFPGPTSDHLLATTRVLHDLMALNKEISRFLNSPGRLEAFFGGRQIELGGIDGDTKDDSWLIQARTISLGDWFAGVKGDLHVESDEPQPWLRFVAQWGDHIAQLESKTFEPTLRFPLASGPPKDVQCAGWLRWLESRMDLARRSLSVILSGEAADRRGHLTVIASEVTPEDFLLVTHAAAKHSYLEDLGAAQIKSDGAGQDAGAQATADTDRVFEASASWADFVQRPATVS
ncbi:MAG: hypothetical protein IID40_00010 [Planctomycetes bacterium]|nr:hypothetical protein [Planctomycetota bacterium]